MSAQAGVLIAGQAQKGLEILEKKLDFDFPNLILKLFVFFTFAYAINKIFEAIILGQNILFQFLGLFGINLPSSLPESLVKFMTEGFNGIKFWDFVKTAAIILVLLEWHIWFNSRDNPSPMTSGIFFILVSGMAIFTIPELLKRVKEMRIITNPAVGR